ncbi:carboxymuconolactone decarboxylase family protein [Paucibacter sp. TC2R-5]|uniref:carboxymuconolactone decarboxylase family protein n=1 Tax=Paucibacter sp. TC2R-5 TaxID=2893555 RepID=UPI0021E3BB2C|nr:carboxymuconolactone decarboxylase family protein [Paucibacter sp. TC2R-5]MCV2359308.1 carboxymuconolactone decarboxylase family protein [Paucibacter sp. TC2R-5]
MSRIAALNPVDAPAQSQPMLAAVKAKLGMVPNLFKTFAHSPAVLQFYLSGSEALSGTSISAALREQIALVTAGENECDYCASAHTLMGKGAGIAAPELAANLRGDSGDAKVKAALTFAKVIVAERGRISDADLALVRAAGYQEAEITEIVATVAANIFTNYFNHVSATDVDFPLVKAAALAAA